MGYEPILDTTTFPATNGTISPSMSLPRLPRPAAASRRTSAIARRMLRFGGLTLDPMGAMVQWRGKAVTLRKEERELLAVLMQNAGRILSVPQIATLLEDKTERVEARLRALHAALRLAGVKCLPRYTNGLGYILW